MKFIFFASKPTPELTEKTLSGFSIFHDTYLICKSPQLVASKNIKNISAMESIEDIYKLAASLDDHCIIAPLGTSFKDSIEDISNVFKKTGLVTWGFEKNNIIYNKFSDSIKFNLIGLADKASQECVKDLRVFSMLNSTHIPEILCNL